MVTTKQCIKRINQLASACIKNMLQLQKIPIADTENFAILATDIMILPIRYISTPLVKGYICLV